MDERSGSFVVKYVSSTYFSLYRDKFRFTVDPGLVASYERNRPRPSYEHGHSDAISYLGVIEWIYIQ